MCHPNDQANTTRLTASRQVPDAQSRTRVKIVAIDVRVVAKPADKVVENVFVAIKRVHVLICSHKRVVPPKKYSSITSAFSTQPPQP